MSDLVAQARRNLIATGSEWTRKQRAASTTRCNKQIRRRSCLRAPSCGRIFETNFTLAESARLMPVNASPSSFTRALKPASSPASRRPQGWRSSSVSSRNRHQARLRQSVLQRSAPIVSRHPLRQQRRHYAPPASSDDALIAPARKGLTGTVASDEPE